jgi:hypothetical protein
MTAGKDWLAHLFHTWPLLGLTLARREGDPCQLVLRFSGIRMFMTEYAFAVVEILAQQLFSCAVSSLICDHQRYPIAGGQCVGMVTVDDPLAVRRFASAPSTLDPRPG